MKKKLLFIIWSFSFGGGAEKVLSDIVNNLDPNKYEIDILEYFHVGIKTEKLNDNINLLKPIIDISNKNIFNKFKTIFINTFITRCPKYFRKKYLNKTYDCEISFNYMIPSLLLNRESKKNICWMHGAIYDLKDNKRLQNIQRKALKDVDKIVAIANKTYQSIVDIFPLYKDKTMIINNGYDFNNIKIKSKELIEDEKIADIIFCGRLDDNKNPLKMLKIFKEVNKYNKKITLGFVGTGNLANDLLSYIKKNKLDNNVILYGYKNNPYKYMNKAKIICMTSISEGFPTVIIEAMSLGKPFISTKVSGVDEMYNDNKCGFIIDDNKEYKDKILELFNNTKLYNDMSKECKKYVLKYSLNNQIDKIEKLIDKED